MSDAIQKIIIVGGGTAGWMTAAALGRFLDHKKYSITLIESEHIGTVGVGEATIPHIRQFNAMLGIDENTFIQATQATYKLAIRFENWGALGSSYYHPFGSFGHSIQGIEFHHYWLKLREAGLAHALDDYSMASVAAHHQRFAYPSPDQDSVLSTFAYAFHLDAGLYAAFLRQYAEAKQVCRQEGKIVSVAQHADTGDITSVTLESGQQIEGDFFIDCSGFAALLIEKTLKTGFESWGHWLPCDRAVALPCERTGTPKPYTLSIARTAGWQWRIPLQHRTGNGHVYCSQFMSDDQAHTQLIENLDGNPTANPNFLKFTAGRRLQSWNKNCVAVGLSSGFLEPLESTSIYLIQVAILKLLEFFPNRDSLAICRTEFNRVLTMEYVRVRDFLILHYKATTRSDSEFWKTCMHMAMPEELQRKMQLFQETGHIEHYEHGLFMVPSWVAVYVGQGMVPGNYDPRLQQGINGRLTDYIQSLRDQVAAAAMTMPDIDSALQKVAQPAQAYPQAHFSLYGGAR